MRLVSLKNQRGTTVRLADWGATLIGIELPDAAAPVRVVLGPDDPDRELPGFPAAGQTVGRVANRIAGARFELDGVEYRLPANDGGKHLHGGPQGFGHVPWIYDSERSREGQSVCFRRTSPDGDQGYPGRLGVAVTYALSDADELVMAYQATTDRATPVSLTNHAYFNLAGQGDVLGHELWMDADRYLPIDREKVPTGEIAPVDGTPFDFRAPRRVGDRLGELEPDPGGYDHCLVLRTDRDARAPCMRLRHPPSGRALEVITGEPGVQLYTGNMLPALVAAGGIRFSRHGAVCLETQHFPDSVHHAQFPSVILRPGETYSTTTIVRFRCEGS